MNAVGEGGGQCGTVGAAEMAAAAGVKKLLLAHIGPHLSQHGAMEKGIGDISRIFGGEIIFTEEIMPVDVVPDGGLYEESHSGGDGHHHGHDHGDGHTHSH